MASEAFRPTPTDSYTVSPNGLFVLQYRASDQMFRLYDSPIHRVSFYEQVVTTADTNPDAQRLAIDVEIAKIRKYCAVVGESDARCQCLDPSGLRKSLKMESGQLDHMELMMPCLVGVCRAVDPQTVQGA